MSTATDQHAALMDYCVAHSCRTCPMSTPQLGALSDDDLCVVSHALDHLKSLAEAEGAIV
jgi:hypothetical protein